MGYPSVASHDTHQSKFTLTSDVIHLRNAKGRQTTTLIRMPEPIADRRPGREFRELFARQKKTVTYQSDARQQAGTPPVPYRMQPVLINQSKRR
jgi:hypothetical protein